MTTIRPVVSCIVEGQGDQLAIPGLIRRIGLAMDPPIVPEIPKPLRISRGLLVKPDGLMKSVEAAARKVHGRGGVIVLIDSDKDCPARLGPELLGHARIQSGHLTLAVVLATQEFESWFIAAAESLQGKRGLSPTLVAPANLESIGGAKGWLAQRMETKKYREVADQPHLQHYSIWRLHAPDRTRSTSFIETLLEY